MCKPHFLELQLCLANSKQGIIPPYPPSRADLSSVKQSGPQESNPSSGEGSSCSIGTGTHGASRGLFKEICLHDQVE